MPPETSSAKSFGSVVLSLFLSRALIHSRFGNGFFWSQVVVIPHAQVHSRTHPSIFTIRVQSPHTLHTCSAEWRNTRQVIHTSPLVSVLASCVASFPQSSSCALLRTRLLSVEPNQPPRLCSSSDYHIITHRARRGGRQLLPVAATSIAINDTTEEARASCCERARLGST